MDDMYVSYVSIKLDEGCFYMYYTLEESIEKLKEFQLNKIDNDPAINM